MTEEGFAITLSVSTPFRSNVTFTAIVVVGASDSMYVNRYRLELEVAYLEVSPYTKVGSSVNVTDLQQDVVASV